MVKVLYSHPLRYWNRLAKLLKPARPSRQKNLMERMPDGQFFIFLSLLIALSVHFYRFSSHTGLVVSRVRCST